MIIPVRCFTCGKVLADKYDYYVRKVKELEAGGEKASVSAAPGAAAAHGATKDRHFEGARTGPILDALGLTRYCCRRTMLGTVDLMEAI